MINKGLSWLGVFFLYLLSLCPFWFLFLISDFFFLIVYHVIGYRRKVVQENMRNSFPEKTEKERQVLERKFYRYLMDLMMETIKMATISEKEIIKRVPSPNPELIEGYFAQGRSVMMAVGHYGNWEMANLRVSIFSSQPLLVVYKPLTNKIFDDFFIKLRSRFGARLVAMKNVMRTMVRHKDDSIMSCFVGDQTPVQHEATYFTEFLNQPTAFFLGIEKMAKLTNPVVVFCDVQRPRRGHYTFKFVPLIENPAETEQHEITEAYVRALEKMIRREPQYWLWSHRRWKFRPEDKK